MSLEALTTEALAAIAAAQDLVALDQVRVQFTGKKSQLAEQSKALGKMDPEALMAFIRENQAAKEFPATHPIRRHFPEETAADIVKESAIEMA
ncbi:MAG: hypothetical protein E6588_13550, partial [Acinetobacter sp.]|nr:hypothetical protein [Acinetobacter sp.]